MAAGSRAAGSRASKGREGVEAGSGKRAASAGCRATGRRRWHHPSPQPTHPISRPLPRTIRRSSVTVACPTGTTVGPEWAACAPATARSAAVWAAPVCAMVAACGPLLAAPRVMVLLRGRGGCEAGRARVWRPWTAKPECCTPAGLLVRSCVSDDSARTSDTGRTRPVKHRADAAARAAAGGGGLKPLGLLFSLRCRTSDEQGSCLHARIATACSPSPSPGRRTRAVGRCPAAVHYKRISSQSEHSFQQQNQQHTKHSCTGGGHSRSLPPRVGGRLAPALFLAGPRGAPPSSLPPRSFTAQSGATCGEREEHSERAREREQKQVGSRVGKGEVVRDARHLPAIPSRRLNRTVPPPSHRGERGKGGRKAGGGGQRQQESVHRRRHNLRLRGASPCDGGPRSAAQRSAAQRTPPSCRSCSCRTARRLAPGPGAPGSRRGCRRPPTGSCAAVD